MNSTLIKDYPDYIISDNGVIVVTPLAPRLAVSRATATMPPSTTRASGPAFASKAKIWPNMPEGSL